MCAHVCNSECFCRLVIWLVNLIRSSRLYVKWKWAMQQQPCNEKKTDFQFMVVNLIFAKHTHTRARHTLHPNKKDDFNCCSHREEQINRISWKIHRTNSNQIKKEPTEKIEIEQCEHLNMAKREKKTHRARDQRTENMC